MTRIRCGHCRGKHGSVADVRACSQGIRVATDHEITAAYPQLSGEAFLNGVPEWRPKTHQQPQQSQKSVEEGFYLLGDQIYKVQIAVHGSGRPYAKRLHIDELTDLELSPELRRPGRKVCHGTWVYEPGLIKRLRPEHRLTAEKAVELGKLYGMCVRCGATLTNEESIERGIGPICARKGF
jgi:hypothetical protein